MGFRPFFCLTPIYAGIGDELQCRTHSGLGEFR
jgi:hypothetical protein